MGRIPQTFIDDLVARTDIVEVIDARVPLKKSGREMHACCPFHEEKTPSFTVSPAKQFYHCFGCGAHGTALGFLMEYGRLDFVEAVEELARRAGVEVPREGGSSDEGRVRTAPIFDMLERASAHFRRCLREHADGPRAVAYLKSRGISGEVARDYALGFAPPGWDNLLRALGTDDDALSALRDAGLVTSREGGGEYDRLRDRIVFPIRDRRGRTVGFGGRVLGDDTPKYLNSPETPVFHKGRELYGLHEARRQPGALERLLVVEGYMDVVALAQAGVANAVATLGTAATAEQIEQMFKACPDVVFCFDGDAAGRRAAWRALENALPCLVPGRQGFFMFLPDGEDPDTLVRAKGRAAFEAAAAEAVSLGTFLFNHLEQEVDLATIDGRTQLVTLARPLLERIPTGTFRRLAARKLAELTGIDERERAAVAGEAVKAPGPAQRGPTRASRAPSGRAAKGRSLVRTAIELLVHHPELAANVPDEPPLGPRMAPLDLPGLGLLVEMIDTARQRPNLSTAGMIEHFREHPNGGHLASLAAREPLLEQGHEQEFDDCIRRLAEQAEALATRARIEGLMAKSLNELSAEERAELKRLHSRVPASGE